MSDIIVTCPYCSGKNTIDSSLKTVHCKWCREDFLIETVDTHVFDDAIRKRNYLEFDEASQELENLLSSGNQSAELYFQLLLCDYGVSYVDVNDEVSIRQIPTLNRLQNKSIFEKDEYKKLEKALSDDKEKLELYRKKLEEIDKIRADAIKLMDKQEPFDVFICYKRTKKINGESYRTKDSDTARRLYQKFDSWGLKVFFAEETLHHEFAGRAFEPIIYSALMSAKIFLLVCASPKEPEILLSPWVKNEWQRYKKRVETETDNQLRLIPVFDNGFEPEQLPKQLYSKKMGNFEGLVLNDEFDNNILNVIKKVIPKEKKKKFQEIVVKKENVSINVATTNISLGSLKGFQLQNLDVSQEALFRMALSDMKADNKRSYGKAYKSLKEITDKNAHNYKANLAKVKCDFEIPYDKQLDKQSLFTLFENKNYDKFVSDFLDLISINDENQSSIHETFFNMLLSTIIETFEKSNFSLFDKILSSDPNKNLFLILFSTFQYDDAKKKEKVDALSNAFLASLKSYKYLKGTNEPTYSYKKSYKTYRKDLDKYNKKESSNSKELVSILDAFIDRLFVPLYASLGEKGSYELINLYYTTHQYLISKYGFNKNFISLNDSLINKILEIHPFYEKALFVKFFRENNFDYSFKKKDESISDSSNKKQSNGSFDFENIFDSLFETKAKEGDSDYKFSTYEDPESVLSHFHKIDLEGEKLKPDYSNLYYILAKTVQGGFKWKIDDDSSFSYTYELIKELIQEKDKNKKKEKVNVKLIKEVTRDFFELVPSTKLSKSSHKKLLNEIGNELLLSGMFEDAELFFEEVLTFEEHDVNILWELVKCELKCITNYDVFLSKKNIHDTKAFRNLVETYISNYPDKVNIHENFYSCVENIKNGKHRERKEYYRLFVFKSKANINERTMDSVESIVNNFNIGQFNEERKQMNMDTNQDQYGVHIFYIPVIFASILAVLMFLSFFFINKLEDWMVLVLCGGLSLLIPILFGKNSKLGRHQVLYYGQYNIRYKKSELALLIYRVILITFTLAFIVGIWGLIPSLSDKFAYIDTILNNLEGLRYYDDSGFMWGDSGTYVIEPEKAKSAILATKIILTSIIVFIATISNQRTLRSRKKIGNLSSASLSFNLLTYITSIVGLLFINQLIIREGSFKFLSSYFSGVIYPIVLGILFGILALYAMVNTFMEDKML